MGKSRIERKIARGFQLDAKPKQGKSKAQNVQPINAEIAVNVIPKDTLPELILKYWPDRLSPDYGTYYLETQGRVPLTLDLSPTKRIIHLSDGDAYLHWNVGDYLATLILTPEVACEYQENSAQMLSIVPDPDDSYVTSMGEKVVPFKLVSVIEPEPPIP